jgi:hypothetical protein
MDRKRKRLAELGRTSFVSRTGIATLLNEFLSIPDDELPTHFSVRTIRRAVGDSCAIQTSYGPLFATSEMRLIDYEPFKFTYLSPIPLIEHLLSECKPFASHMRAALVANPPSISKPWRIALYSDEVLPGNQIKALNHRKIQAIYWAIVELGELGNENMWFPWAFLKSDDVKMMQGGMSNVFRFVVKSFFNDNGHNLATSGMILRFADGFSQLLFAKLGAMISDESALHQTWLNKGAGGTMFCMLCSNISSAKSELADHDTTHQIVPATELDFHKCILHTSASIRALLRRLADFAAHSSKTALEKFEQELGFSNCPESILMDTSIAAYVDPCQITMYDWCHVFVVSGVFNLTLGLLMHSLQSDFGICYSDLDAYIKLWKLPTRHESSGNGMDVACARRATSSYEESTFKCTASEALSVYPIVARWVETVVKVSLQTHPANHNIIAACDCFLLLCIVLDMFKQTMRSQHDVTPSSLHNAIVACMRVFLVAHGIGAWIPKCHFALHFGWFLQTFGFLASCFVHERKHKLAKRYGNQMCRLRGFDAYVLREVFLKQCMSLRSSNLFSCVEHLNTPSKKSAAVLQEYFPAAVDIKISRVADVGLGGKVHIGDVVAFRDGRVGEVWLHAVIDGQVLSCVSRWMRVAVDTYTVCDTPEFIALSEIREALTYSRTDDRVLIIPAL